PRAACLPFTPLFRSISFGASLQAGEYIDSVRVFAPGNPRPEVIDLHYAGPAPVSVNTRMRLRESQPVFAVATSNQGRRWLAVREDRKSTRLNSSHVK